ncbi:hypothetical protein MTO96_001791 [Rhipicephalus appendiculatus]
MRGKVLAIVCCLLGSAVSSRAAPLGQHQEYISLALEPTTASGVTEQSIASVPGGTVGGITSATSSVTPSAVGSTVSIGSIQTPWGAAGFPYSSSAGYPSFAGFSNLYGGYYRGYPGYGSYLSHSYGLSGFSSPWGYLHDSAYGSLGYPGALGGLPGGAFMATTVITLDLDAGQDFWEDTLL